MTPGLPRARLLPATIAAMALLLAVKSVALVQAATASGDPPDAAAGKDVAAPAAQAAGVQAAGVQAAGVQAAGVQTGGVQTGGGQTGGAAAGDLPKPAVAVAPPVSDAERGLLLDLRRRRDELEARSRLLDEREAVLAAAQTKLAARVDELNALQAKLETLESARQSHDSANWDGLVRVYETMKPRDAATIFDALDMQVLLGVLDRMSARKVAPILAAMQPDRARLATQMLAEMRTRAVTPPGEQPPLHAPDPKG